MKRTDVKEKGAETKRVVSWNGENRSMKEFLNELEKRNPGESNFLESVEEVLASVWDLIADNRAYQEVNILERLVEPERVIQFRVPWHDDRNQVRVNRGWRVEFSSVLGPYKGGLRFHPTVNLDVLKFLGFEQTFKNGLTTLPMGGGKGGSDFDPRGCSDRELMRFCQSFMSELFRHIGSRTDVPAGDIGVGSLEIGYLFGQYRRLTNRFEGALTGKGINWGGSPMRVEATGYGLVYFVREIFDRRAETLEERRVSISGSGNVALYAGKKVLDLGGILISLSDSGGTLYAEEGISADLLERITELKEGRKGRLSELKGEAGLEYLEDERPWRIPCDIALPCATENELNTEDADCLIKNGCICVAEGANKPSTPGAIRRFQQSDLLFAPGKAANAGGVAVSGLEMAQNGAHTTWEAKAVNDQLQSIMASIHDICISYGVTYDGVDYLRGANRAGFVKVADAMLAQGVV